MHTHTGNSALVRASFDHVIAVTISPTRILTSVCSYLVQLTAAVANGLCTRDQLS